MLTRIVLAVVMACMLPVPAAHAAAEAGSAKILKSTADHCKFKELKQEFNSGPEVTKACLGCHTEGRQADSQDRALELGIQESGGATPGQAARHQQLLYFDYIQRGRLRRLSCRLRLQGRKVRLHVGSQCRLPGLPRHHRQLQETHRFSGNPVTKEMEFPPGSGKFIRPVDLKDVAQHVGKTSRTPAAPAISTAAAAMVSSTATWTARSKRRRSR